MKFEERMSSKALVAFAVILVTTCSAERSVLDNNPYDRLCSIYEEELEGKDSPGATIFQKLSNRLAEEVPDLEEQLSHLANFSKTEFYPALKDMAEHHTGKPWECGFIKRRYER